MSAITPMEQYLTFSLMSRCANVSSILCLWAGWMELISQYALSYQFFRGG